MECYPIMTELEKRHVETFDMLHYFQDHEINATNASEYYLPTDGHHNNHGYAVMAQGLGTLL